MIYWDTKIRHASGFKLEMTQCELDTRLRMDNIWTRTNIGMKNIWVWTTSGHGQHLGVEWGLYPDIQIFQD